jgi:integrase
MIVRVRRKRDLLHSYAIGALTAGISPKVISERIGHANVGFFLQTYAHVLRNDDRDAAEQAASFLIGYGWDPGEDGAAEDDETV